ncbi:UvrD-helicase domain-containing protein [candidate division KSB1 bacterium]|nr:UvrD-helicase domain-containing protein [candidate division KSB1 bacterium]
MSAQGTTSKKAAQITKNLNPAQQQAVLWTEGPALILAGAGSGKTRVLMHKIAYLIEVNKIAPWKILAMTFTNKAASEMRERIRTISHQNSDTIWMGTFHSLFARILRKECTAIGYQSNFSIYDADDQIQLIKMIMNDLNIPPKSVIPKAVQSQISRSKNALISPEQYQRRAENMFEDYVGQIFTEYQKRLRTLNAMDFDDLLGNPIELFGANPEILSHYQERFDYILVDEYQDTNHAQYRIIKLLSQRHRNITVVGDDDQSIYAWRGADINNILDFEKDFPECRTFRLEQNYRSTQNILSAAHSVVKNNQGRLDKTLWTTQESGEKVTLIHCWDAFAEALKIVTKIQDEFRVNKRDFKDFAILYRTNAQSRIIEDGLRNHGIPYIIVGGTRFYERKEVKDVIAYLRIIDNPLDTICLKRIINFPQRGIGAATIKKIDQFTIEKRLSFFEALKKISFIEGIAESIKMRISNFCQIIEKYQSLQDKLSISELARTLVDEVGILSNFKNEGTVEAMSRYENVFELLSAITEFSKRTEKPTLSAFLEEVTLVTDIDNWDNRGNAVTLMTLHSAKGLEFPVVFITGLEEGLFPLSRNSEKTSQLEEERRLFYVGATRAQKKLYLSSAKRRNYGMETFLSEPSRFINEIDQQFVDLEFPKQTEGGRRGDRISRRDEGSYYDFNYHTDALPQQEEAFPVIQILDIGMRVFHESFGNGTVLDIEGRGENTKVTINFESVGKKKLMVKYANLEII